MAWQPELGQGAIASPDYRARCGLTVQPSRETSAACALESPSSSTGSPRREDRTDRSTRRCACGSREADPTCVEQLARAPSPSALSGEMHKRQRMGGGRHAVVRRRYGSAVGGQRRQRKPPAAPVSGSCRRRGAGNAGCSLGCQPEWMRPPPDAGYDGVAPASEKTPVTLDPAVEVLLDKVFANSPDRIGPLALVDVWFDSDRTSPSGTAVTVNVGETARRRAGRRRIPAFHDSHRGGGDLRHGAQAERNVDEGSASPAALPACRRGALASTGSGLS